MLWLLDRSTSSMKVLTPPAAVSTIHGKNVSGRRTMTALRASNETRPQPSFADGEVFCTTALLFDLDGTLVDTAEAVELSWEQAAQELDVPFDRLAPYIHGIPADQALGLAVPWLAGPRRAELAQRILAAQASDTAPVELMPGASALLGRIPPDRWGVVTSGDERLAQASIRKARLPAPLEMVTADDVEHGKPHPEPYLLGAQLLQVSQPALSIAVEDSPAGIASAHAAGMRVVAVATTFAPEELSDADWLVPDLRWLTVTAIPDGLLIEIARPTV
jgi:sugar-phosphatase